MTITYRRAALLAGLALAGCAQLNPPAANPQPQAKIIATSDATYMQPAGESAEHMVPEPAPRGPFGGFSVHSPSAGAPASPVGGDRLAALENRVTRLEDEVGALNAAHEQHTSPAAVSASDALPQNGAAAPPPASVQPAPLADAAPVSLAAVTHDRPAPPTKKNVLAATAAGKIGALRIGEHPGLTRIVLDCGERHAFHADLDNDTRILTVQIGGAEWTDGKGEHPVARSPLVSSWQAASDGKGGTRFVLQLRRNAKIIADHFLPGAGAAGARLVIDLASAG